MAWSWSKALRGGAASLSASYGDHLESQREWERQQKIMEAQTMKQKEMAQWQRGMQKQWGEEDYQSGLLKKQQEATELYGSLDDPRAKAHIYGGYEQSMEEKIADKKLLTEAEIDTKIANMDKTTKAQLEAEAKLNGVTLEEYIAGKKSQFKESTKSTKDKAIETAEAQVAGAGVLVKAIGEDIDTPQGQQIFKAIIGIKSQAPNFEVEDLRQIQKEANAAAEAEAENFTPDDIKMAKKDWFDMTGEQLSDREIKAKMQQQLQGQYFNKYLIQIDNIVNPQDPEAGPAPGALQGPGMVTDGMPEVETAPQGQPEETGWTRPDEGPQWFQKLINKFKNASSRTQREYDKYKPRG